MHESQRRGEQRGNVVVIGEALVDIVGGRAIPGGSPANVALALGRLGASVTLATQLGDDANGTLIRDHLGASGVDVLASPAPKTSIAHAQIGLSGAATYEFDVSWCPVFRDLPQADVVHVGSFSAVWGHTVRDLLDQTAATVTYDINIRPQLLRAGAGDQVKELVNRADLVKASDEDLHWLYPASTPQQAAMALLDLGPAAVYVTLGADGALVVTAETSRAIAPMRVDVVDTIGAGDSFSAGLIYALGREGCLGGRLTADIETLHRAGRFAAFLASQTAAREGANPPYDVDYPTALRALPPP